MRTTTLVRWTSTWLLALGITGQARAGDWYVNAATGNDANDGASPGTAWRTIAHAGNAAPPGAGHTVHLAPGTYFESSIYFRGQHLIGDGGPLVTHIDGGGTGGSILTGFRSGASVDSTFASIRGLELRHGAEAITVVTYQGDVATVIEDVVVSDVLRAVYAATIRSQGGTLSSDVVLTVRNLRVSNCYEAVRLGSRGPDQLDAEISDSILEGGLQNGIYLECQEGGTLRADLHRCRLRGNGARGVLATADLGTELRGTFESCAITGNPVGAHLITSPGGTAPREMRFQDCTIAGNSTNSVIGTAGFVLRLRGTLVHGNGTDAIQGTVVESVANWIGGPDPQFVDAAGDDWRLRITSPCIDVGDVASPSGQRDLLGRPRPIDGNLDLIEHADIGAFEFAPLDVQTTGATGSAARIELTARAAGTAFVYFARTGTVAPRTTAYGEWDLGPRAPLQFTRMLVADVPSVLMRPIPPGAGLPGETISLQALLPSGTAPLGQAWSNPIEITIQP